MSRRMVTPAALCLQSTGLTCKGLCRVCLCGRGLQGLLKALQRLWQTAGAVLSMPCSRNCCQRQRHRVPSRSTGSACNSSNQSWSPVSMRVCAHIMMHFSNVREVHRA